MPNSQKNTRQSTVDPHITWDPGTTGMALLRIAAMYVDLADQLLDQSAEGALPGILRNRQFAWEIGCLAIGPEPFRKLIEEGKAKVSSRRTKS